MIWSKFNVQSVAFQVKFVFFLNADGRNEAMDSTCPTGTLLFKSILGSEVYVLLFSLDTLIILIYFCVDKNKLISG